MNEAQLISLLEKTGVIMDGHFLLTSGRHSDRFLQCSQLLQYPEHSHTVAVQMAEPFKNQGIETVIGPAMGGVILAYAVARALGARAIYAEPSEDKMILRRSFSLTAGEKVLVVEDAISTGGSVQKVLDLLHSEKAEPLAVAAIVDRSAGKVKLTVPLVSLLQLEIQSYLPEECPLCKERIALSKPKGKPVKKG